MATAASNSAFDTARALRDLVAEGALTWGGAVMMFRQEFGWTYLECTEAGVIKLIQDADKEWRKKVQVIRVGMHKLAHIT